MAMKKHTTEINRNNDQRHPDMSNQSDNNASSLLIKIEHRLFHLERKVDSIISMLQEKQNSDNSQAEKPFKKKSLLRISKTSGRSNNRRPEKRNEGSGKNDPGETFYSRFAKPYKRSGPNSRNKPFHRKPGK